MALRQSLLVVAYLKLEGFKKQDDIKVYLNK